jgi:hypothetical protein
MADMSAALAEHDVRPDRIHMEIFNGGESSMPGVVGTVTKTAAGSPRRRRCRSVTAKPAPRAESQSAVAASRVLASA